MPLGISSLSWLISCGCGYAMFRRARALGQLQIPSCDRLIGTIDSATMACVVAAEIDDQVLEMDAATSADPRVSQALARAALASGTACALLCLTRGFGLAEFTAASFAFCGGLMGTGATAYFGRLARQRSQQARAEFRESVRRARTRLQHLHERG